MVGRSVAYAVVRPVRSSCPVWLAAAGSRVTIVLVTSDDARAMGQGSARHRPTSHRKPGPAALDMPPPKPWEAFTTEVRPTLLVLVGTVSSLSWGGAALLGEGPLGGRAIGFGVLIAGALLALSYTLRFFPAVMNRSKWSITRPRRILRLTRWTTWVLYFAGCVVAAIALFFIER